MKSCELVVMPIAGFFIFKNNATPRKLRGARTCLYSLAKVMRSPKKL